MIFPDNTNDSLSTDGIISVCSTPYSPTQIPKKTTIRTVSINTNNDNIQGNNSPIPIRKTTRSVSINTTNDNIQGNNFKNNLNSRSLDVFSNVFPSNNNNNYNNFNNFEKKNEHENENKIRLKKSSSSFTFGSIPTPLKNSHSHNSILAALSAVKNKYDDTRYNNINNKNINVNSNSNLNKIKKNISDNNSSSYGVSPKSFSEGGIFNGLGRYVYDLWHLCLCYAYLYVYISSVWC